MLFQTMLIGVSISNAFGVLCYSKLCYSGSQYLTLSEFYVIPNYVNGGLNI